MNVVALEEAHVPGIAELARVGGWPSYADEATARAALTAPGVTTTVALDGDTVVGFAQLQSDGVVQAHLSMVAVAPSHRRRGIARELVSQALARAGGKRVDLIAEDEEAAAFYRHAFVHREAAGFRIYPEPR